MQLFVFGLGYSGRAIAELAKARGWMVAGTVRSEEKAENLRSDGIDAHIFDGARLHASAAASLAQASHIVLSIAPGEAGDPVLSNLAETLTNSNSLRWLGYLSTVGVYGNHDGAWVDEGSPCHPVSKRSRQRVDAEKAWLDFVVHAKLPLAIFRLSGIYGPGRSAIDKLHAGSARRIVKPGQVFNRIFVDDIAATVFAAAERSASGIFNTTDDEPAPPQDVVAYAANLIGAPVPPDIPFHDAPLSPMGRSFYGENKRVRNDRIKSGLGVQLAAPTYREGLALILAAES